MKTFADKILEQREVLDTIRNVRGERYAKMVRHSYSIAEIHRLIDKDLAAPFACFASNILIDLGIAYGVDITDKKTSDSLIKDLEALGLELLP